MRVKEREIEVERRREGSSMIMMKHEGDNMRTGSYDTGSFDDW